MDDENQVFLLRCSPCPILPKRNIGNHEKDSRFTQNTGWWQTYPSEKMMEFVSWMMTFHSPTVSGKPIQIPWFQTNNQNIIILLLYIPSGNLTWLLKIVHLYGKKNVSNHQPEHIRKSSKVVSFWAKRHVFCYRKQRWKATGAFAPERRPEKPLPLTKNGEKCEDSSYPKKNEEFIIIYPLVN